MENEMMINSQGSSDVRDHLLSSVNVVTVCDLIVKNNTKKYRERLHTDIVNSIHFHRMPSEGVRKHDSQARRTRTIVRYEMCMPSTNKWIIKPEKSPPPHIRRLFEQPVLSNYDTTLKELSEFLRSNQRVPPLPSDENLDEKLHEGVSTETPELSSLQKEPSVSTHKGSQSSLPGSSLSNVVQGEERTQMEDTQENTKSVPSEVKVSTPKGSQSSLPVSSHSNVVQGEERIQMEDTQENTKSVPSEVKGDGSELLCSVDSETPTHELERMSSSSLCKKDQPDEDLEKRLLSPLEENPVVLEDTTGNLTEQLCEEQGETSKIVKKNALLLACPLPPPGTPSCSSSREGREGSSRFAGSSEGVRYFQNFVPKRNPNSALPNTQFIEFKTSSPES